MSYSFSENQWGEKYIEELNRTDFTNMKSAEFFHRILDCDLSLENTLYLIIGSDSGLLLTHFKQLTLGRGSRLAFIEHDDVYPIIAAEYNDFFAAERNPESGNTHSVSLHTHSLWQKEVFDDSEKPWLVSGQVKIVESTACAADYVHIYMPVLRTVKKAVEQRIADISVPLNRAVFAKMQFRNATDNHTPLKTSSVFGDGKTAIILGGGPSLDYHLDWIVSNREKLFVLAVSRLAGKLMDLDFKPDLLLSVDPIDRAYEYCKTGLLWTDVPLVHNFHVSPKLLQQWQGPSFYLGKRLPWHGRKQLEGNIPSSGPTVSHAATIVAFQLGFSQILLVGVDLCYSVSASTHAEASPEQILQQLPSLCDARVETYNGRIAGTCINLKQGLDSLERIGQLINSRKPTLFHISDHAARCQSIPYKCIDDISLPDSRPDITTHLDLEPKIVTLEELNQLDTELKAARHAFTKMRALCSEAITCVKTIHAAESDPRTKKTSIRLTKIRKQLENEYSGYLEATMYENEADFNRTISPTEFEEMTSEELLAWGCHYYKLIDQGAKSMIDHIHSVNARISLRRDENDPDINIRELAKRWREDDTPGRILLWKRLRWQHVEPRDRAWVQRAIGKFRSTLNAPLSSIKDALLEKSEDINNVMKSLVFLSQNQSTTELQAIESRFSTSNWPYCALKPFTNGLILELHKENLSALASFQQSIDKCSEQLEKKTDSLASMQRLIEECLVRMTQCYINAEDYDSALSTLGTLCEMLPSYVISYAKLLHMCARSKFAIDILESYISLYPTHKNATFLLSQIRTENMTGSEDPAYVEKVSGAMQAIMGGGG